MYISNDLHFANTNSETLKNKTINFKTSVFE